MKHLSEEQIARYADALDEGTVHHLPAQIRDHVKECDQCAGEVMAVYDLITQDSKSERPVFPIQSKSSKRNVAFAIAAGLILLVGIGGFLLLFNPAGQQPQMVEQPKEIIADTIDSDTSEEYGSIDEKETGKKPSLERPADSEVKTTRESVRTKQPELLAEAFEPSQPLERLVNRFEDSAYRGNEVEITTAKLIRVDKNQPFTLSWESEEGRTLTIELLNNKGENILETSTGKNEITIDKDLQPGLYYWKLYNNEFDLLFAGKIIIK